MTAPQPPQEHDRSALAAEMTPMAMLSAALAHSDGAAQALARRTGLTHAQVNAELNRRANVRKVSEATAQQLRARLEVADRWLAQT